MQDNTFWSIIAACIASVAIAFGGCIYQYYDGVTSLRRQAIDRGCSITPVMSDYIIDCRAH